MVSIGIGVVNVGLDFVLIPVMGIAGAAVATATAFILGGIAHTFVVKWRVGLNNYRNYPWVLPAIAAMVGALVIDGLLLRVGLLMVIAAAALWTARRRGIFDGETLVALERIDMPGPLKRLVRVGYQKVLEGNSD